VNISIKGLAEYGLERPSLPGGVSFLIRGAWEPQEHATELHDLLMGDVRLLAALRWLRHEPERTALREGTPDEVTAILDELGPSLAREMVLGVLLFRSLRVGPCDELDYDDYWARALARGLAAKHMAGLFGQEDPERAFLSGLFTNLGQLILAETFPERYAAVLAGHGTSTSELTRREREVFGIDRHSIAWAVLRDLGFGRSVFEPMLVESRALRGHGQAEVDGDPASLEVQHASRLLGDIMCAEAFERQSLWSELIGMRTKHDLNRDVVNALADEVVSDWWNWGDLLVIPTRTLPSFAELCDWNERNIEPVRYNPIRTGGLVAEEERTGLHVLLVDDAPVIVRGTQRRLERAGMRVTTACNGEEALAKLRQDPPQVVLSDWHMPEMDGLELCRNLRRTELGQRIFFILFTAEAKTEEIVKAYEDGINDFIDKHAENEILLARVQAARTFLLHWEAIDRDRRIIRAHCDRSRKLAARLQKDSMTDTLTGLPNRRFAMERLREEWSRSDRTGEPLSVLMMDIDHFKWVNDNHGHDVGDVVLQETATTLRESARRNETICRIGGEEFLVICSGSDLSQAARAAERLRKAVAASVVRTQDFERALTLSLGVAQRSPLVKGVDALLKCADEAIYGAKEGGRDQVVLWPSMERAQFDGTDPSDRLVG